MCCGVCGVFVYSNLFCVQAGPGSITMAATIHDYQRTEADRLNEVKGHLEIALLEKHFLRKYFFLHNLIFCELTGVGMSWQGVNMCTPGNSFKTLGIPGEK